MTTLPGKKTKKAPSVEAPSVEAPPVEAPPVEAPPVEAPPIQETESPPVEFLSVEEMENLSGNPDKTSPAPVSPRTYAGVNIDKVIKTSTPSPATTTPSPEDPNAIEILSAEDMDQYRKPWERTVEPGWTERMWNHLTGSDRGPDEYNLRRLAAIIGSQIGGTYIGSRIPTAPGISGLLVNRITGMFIGSAVGSKIGYSFPEMILELGEKTGHLPKGYREKHGLTPSRLAWESHNEAVLDMFFGGAITASKMAWRLSSRSATGSGPVGKNIAEEAARRFDINLAPVHVGKRTFARMFVNVMGRFPFIGTRIRKVGGEAEQQLSKAYENLGVNAFKEVGSRVGVLVADNKISRLIFTDAKALMKDFNDTFGGWYELIWKEADALGITIRPTQLQAEAQKVLAVINQKARVKLDGTVVDGAIMAKVRKFIDEEVVSLAETQTLRSMDGFVESVDEFLLTMDRSEREYAKTLMYRIRTAATEDLATPIGAEAAQITEKLRALDGEFSTAMNALFETATAKQMKKVVTGGVKKMVRMSDEMTQQHIDSLSKYMVDLESPDSVTELYRLVTPETFQKIVTKTLDNAVQTSKSINNEVETFSALKFARALGLDPKVISNRTESVGKMLKLSGSSITVAELDSLIRITEAIASLPLPNASVFLQRKAVIGGLTGAIRGALPGVAVAAGSGMVAGLFGMIMMIGGGKAIAALLTDKKAVQPLRKILHLEAKSIFKLKLIPQALRAAVSVMVGEGSISREIGGQLLERIPDMNAQFEAEYNSQNSDDKDVTISLKEPLSMDITVPKNEVEEIQKTLQLN